MNAASGANPANPVSSGILENPEELVTSLGAHPVGLLAMLVMTAAISVTLIVVVFNFAGEHARRRWGARVGRFAYLIIHLVLGLTGVIGVAIFLSLATRIDASSTASHIDLALARSLHAAKTPLVTDVLRVVTFLGEGWIQMIIGLVVGGLLLRVRRKLWALSWAFALAGGGILNSTLKLAYQRPRPVFADPILIASGFSFPSGHSMGTFILAGMGAYLGVLHTNGRGRHVAIVATALAWAVTMGFSRMYLGVHYLTDVVGGFAAGSCWLAVCISGVEVARRRPRLPTVPAASVAK